MILSIYILISVTTGVAIWWSGCLDARHEGGWPVQYGLLVAMCVFWPFWWTLVGLFWLFERRRY